LDILLTLPKQITFGKTPVKCFGIAGTDSENITCTTDARKKQVRITDAVRYQRGNPGTIRIVIDNLKNPKQNIVTDSFVVQTYTSDGWVLDEIRQNVTVNFYCEYPCASCNKEQKD